MFHQVSSHDRCRDPRLGELARDVESRGNQRRLDRVQHVEARGQIAETVPLRIGLQQPVFTLANPVISQLFGAPDLEPPVLTPFIFDLPHRSPEVQGFRDGFFDQCGTTGRFHHRCRHVAGCNDRVLGRG